MSELGILKLINKLRKDVDYLLRKEYTIGGNAGDTVAEGPGIDIVSGADEQIGIGGDSILLYDSGGDPCAEYAASDAGLTAALAAMSLGDVIEICDVTITGGPWTVAYGTMRGHSQSGTVLDGEVDITAGCYVENLSVIRTEDSAGDIIGVVLDGDATVEDCRIEVTNVTGNAYGVYSEADVEGDCYIRDCCITATAGGDGYGCATDGASMYVEGGESTGSTAPVRM